MEDSKRNDFLEKSMKSFLVNTKKNKRKIPVVQQGTGKIPEALRQKVVVGNQPLGQGSEDGPTVSIVSPKEAVSPKGEEEKKKISPKEETEKYEILKKTLTCFRNDLVEIFHSLKTKFYPKFFPLLFGLLDVIPCQFVNNVKQDCRKLIVEILQRLPRRRELIPEVMDLLKVSMKVLREDNEENAILSIRVIMDLHKKFMKKVPDLRNCVQDFLNFVKLLYSNFQTIVKNLFDVQVIKNTHSLRKSTFSCRVLTECPLLVVFLFQAYKKPTEHNNLNDLLDTMISSLAYKVSQENKENLTFRRNYGILIACKVKTASFLAYTLRVYHKYVTKQNEKIPKLVTELLLNCPPECVQARKELLVIMRHLIDSRNSNLRGHFIPYISKFLIDENLISKNNIAHESMRPLAYSTLADLIHHVRNGLTLSLISKTVSFYTKVMYDHTLKLAIQTMSAKLLVHLVESIFISKEKIRGRVILLNIMEAFICKIKSLSRSIKKIVAGKEPSNLRDLNAPRGYRGYRGKSKRDSVIFQCKVMVKTLVLGLKNVVYVIHNLDRGVAQAKIEAGGQRKPLRFERTKLFKGLFRHGLECFQIYEVNKDQRGGDSAKENLDAFSSLFAVLPSTQFQEILKESIPFLINKINENPLFLHVPRSFLKSVKLTHVFSKILCTYLVGALDELRGKETGKIFFKLFKLVFQSMMNLQHQEKSLQSFCPDIIMGCLRKASRAIESINYLTLLQMLFKHLLTGKFEAVQKTLYPHLNYIVEKLGSLLKGQPSGPYRDIVVELHLMIPVRMFILVPFIPKIVTPVLFSLESGVTLKNEHLLAVGLRVLDIWVDCMTQQTLLPLLEPILPRLLQALYMILKPKPQGDHGATTMKILAKFGGNCRKYFTMGPTELRESYNHNPEGKPKCRSRFNMKSDNTMDEGDDFVSDKDSQTFGLKYGDYLRVARRAIHKKHSHVDAKERSVKFAQSLFMSLVERESDVSKFAIPETIISVKKKPRFPSFLSSGYNYLFPDHSKKGQKTMKAVEAEEHFFKFVICTIFETVTTHGLDEETGPFVDEVIGFFSMLLIKRNNYKNESFEIFKTRVFVDALVDAILFDYVPGLVLLQKFFDTMFALCNEDLSLTVQFEVWNVLLRKLCHYCYHSDWKRKLGGCQGIRKCLEFLPKELVQKFETDIVWALFYSVKDSPEEVETDVLRCAKATLKKLLEITQTAFLETKNFNPSKSFVSVEKTIEDKRLQNLFQILITQLTDNSGHVRNMAIAIIDEICKISGHRRGDFLKSFKTNLTNTLSSKNFEGLARASMRGFAEAMRFLFSSQPFVVDITTDVIRVLQFIEKMVNERDLPKNYKHHEDSGRNKKMIISFSALLCTVLTNKEIVGKTEGVQTGLRGIKMGVIKLFYHLIEDKEKEYVEIAKRGLYAVAQSKDAQLQAFSRLTMKEVLKPHLTALGQPKDLHMRNLRILKILLKLNPAFFKEKFFEVTIGLITTWGNKGKFPKFKNEKDRTEAGAILVGYLHLLPARPQFSHDVQKVIETVIRLENAFTTHCIKLDSPFREPLARFLNGYPKESSLYFLSDSPLSKSSRLKNEKVFDLLMHCISMNNVFMNVTQYIVKYMQKKLISPLSKGGSTTQDPKLELRSLQIIYQIEKLGFGFLKESKELSSAVRLVWRGYMSGERHKVLSSDHDHIKKLRVLSKSLMSHYNSQREIDKQVLFELLLAFSDKTAIDFGYLREFYESQLPRFNTKMKRNIITHQLANFRKKCKISTLLEELIIEGFVQLVNPIIAHSVKDNSIGETFDDELLARVIRVLEVTKFFNYFPNGCHVETLRMITLFVKHLPKRMAKYQKTIWEYCKYFIPIDRITFKQCIFELAATLVDQYLFAPNEIVWLYSEMLKSEYVEGKVAVKSALDMIVAKIMTIEELTEVKNNMPKWIAVTLNVINEEGFSISRLNHIWKLVLCFRGAFYECRDKFVMKMIGSLNRIGVSTNLSYENRKLSLDVVRCVLEWQKKSIEEDKKGKNKSSDDMDTDEFVVNPKKRRRDDSNDVEEEKRATKKVKSDIGEIKIAEKAKKKQVTNSSANELIADFLFTVIRIVHSRQPSSKAAYGHVTGLSNEACELFTQSLQQCRNHKLSFEKVMNLVRLPQNEELSISGLRVITTIVEFQSELIHKNISELYPLANMFLSSKSSGVLEGFLKFIQHMTVVWNPSKTKKTGVPSDIQKFYKSLWDSVKLGFIHWDRSGRGSQGFSINIYGYLKLLSILCNRAPEEAYSFTSTIHNILKKLLKLYMNRTTTELHLKEQENNQEYADNLSRVEISRMRKKYLATITRNLKTNVPSIEICIRFLSNSTHHNCAHDFYSFLCTMGQILEKSDFFSPKIICAFIVMLKDWLLNPSTDGYTGMNYKQKMYYINKLFKSEFIETDDDVLRKEYFDLVHSLFVSKHIINQDSHLPNRVRALFLNGIKSTDVEIRRKFLESLNKHVGKTIFERMVFIAQSEHWEYLKGWFWIHAATDILLHAVNPDTQIDYGKYAKIPSLNRGGIRIDEGEDENKFEYYPYKKKYVPSEKAKAVILRVENFVKKVENLKLADIVEPLRKMYFFSFELTQTLWVNLFTGAWKVLSTKQRQVLHKPFLVLLARDFHSSQYIKYPNVVQSLLKGTLQLDNFTISPDQLRFLGKSFNCWDTVLPVLERKLEALLKNSLDQEIIERYTTSLTELYKTLNEDEMLYGIWRCFGVQEETKCLFSLTLMNSWQNCSDFLNKLFKVFHEGHVDRTGIYHPEISLWEDIWLKSAKKLQNWEELKVFSDNGHVPMLELECLWNQGAWKDIDSLFRDNITARTQSSLHIYQVSQAVMDNRIQEAIVFFNHACQQALQRWCALPNFHCNTHVQMLHQVQQLQELFEGSQFLADGTSAIHSKPKTETFLRKWEDRIPLDHADSAFWNDIITWRTHFLEKIAFSLPQRDTATKNACLKEMSKTLRKYTRVLRKQGLMQTAKMHVNKVKKLTKSMTDRTDQDNNDFDVQVEKVRLLTSEGRFMEAINFLNTDELMNSVKTNKLEIIQLRLKGKLNGLVGNFDEASKYFSVAIDTFPGKYLNYRNANYSLGKVFYNWGKVLDAKFRKNTKTVGDAEQAIVSFMQAARFQVDLTQSVPRILYLLGYANQNDEKGQKTTMVKTMSHCLVDCPIWMFLPWMENIFTMLQRIPESHVAKLILTKLADQYPQAVYWFVRAFCRTACMPTPALIFPKLKVQDSQNPFLAVHKHLCELLAGFMKTKKGFISEVEMFIKDFQTKLKPEVEEELLRSLEIVHLMCCEESFYKEASAKIIGTIEKLKKTFFMTTVKLSDFLTDVKAELLKDFDFKKSKKTIRDLVLKLRKWITIFDREVSKYPNVYLLESCSTTLSRLRCTELEVPGQYIGSFERPYVDIHQKMLHLSPDVTVKRMQKINVRKIKIVNYSGDKSTFVLSTSPYVFQNHLSRNKMEERMYSMLRNINFLLHRNYMFKRKMYRISTPIIIPIVPRVRLIQEESKFISLEQPFNEYCFKKKVPIDHFYVEYWKEMNKQRSNTGKEKNASKRPSNMNILLKMANRHAAEKKKVYDSFKHVAKMFPKTVLHEYINKNCKTWNSFFSIRKEFANQLGVMGLMRFLVNIESCNPEDYFISISSGRLHQFGLKAKMYVGIPNRQQESQGVPFRLTRNLVRFFSKFCIEGFTLSSIAVSAAALLRKETSFLDEVRLFMRDDLINVFNVCENHGLIPFVEDEMKLKQLTEVNVGRVRRNLAKFIPLENKPSDIKTTAGVVFIHNITQQAKNLINQARDNDSLSQMKLSWNAFF